MVPETVTALAALPDETVMVAPQSVRLFATRVTLPIINAPTAKRALPITGSPGNAMALVIPAFSSWLCNKSVIDRKLRGIVNLQSNNTIDSNTISLF
jgi:hypothetical protein